MYRDLTRGTILRSLLLFALPMLAGDILQQLYNIADTLIVSRAIGRDALAAVGSAYTLMIFLTSILLGLSMGAGALFSICRGRGDESGLRRSIVHAFGLIGVCTLLLTALAYALLPALLRLLQVPESVSPLMRTYLAVIFAGIPATFLYNFFACLLRSVGNSMTPLVFSGISALGNVALDLLFVLVFPWGVAGAAWATAASQAISAVLCILYLRRKAPELIFARADCRMDGELLKQTAHFSFVTALHQSSLYIGKLLVQGAVNTGGTDMISAYTATTRIEGFANSFGDSGSAATSVLVAQNRGAGKEERVKESFRSSLFLMLAMGLAMSLIMYVSASTSVGFMFGTRSGAAFENARDYLKLVALFYTLCFTGNTFAGYFNGIGKVSVPFLGATSHIALRVVLSWLLVGKMGLPAVALAAGLGWVLVNALWTVIKWGMERKVKMQTVKKSK